MNTKQKVMKSVYAFLASQELVPANITIATVISSSGSTPAKEGSSALFTGEGLKYGTVGGGALERRVAEIAAQFCGKQRAAIFHFNLDNQISGEEDAICGGEVKVLIDSTVLSDKMFLSGIRDLIERKVPFVVARTAERMDGEEYRISAGIISEEFCYNIYDGSGESLIQEITGKIASGANEGIFNVIKMHSGKTESLMVLESVFRPPQLFIAGAGHVGRAVCTLGSFLGFEVTVIDDRPEYANRNNIPEADNIIVNDIGTAISDIKKDRNTFIVIVTRGHSSDAEALRPCINSGAAYVGMIGSRKKTEQMRDNFISRGWATPEQWDMVYTPIGLSINSGTVEEIALSIAAELIKVKNSSWNGS